MAKKRTSKYGIKKIGEYEIQDIEIMVVSWPNHQGQVKSSVLHDKPGTVAPITGGKYDFMTRTTVGGAIAPHRLFKNDIQTLDVEFDGYSWMSSGVRIRVTVHDPINGPFEATMDSTSFYNLIKDNILDKGRTIGKFTWDWNGQNTNLLYLGV